MDLEFLHTSLQRQEVCIKCIKSSVCVCVCIRSTVCSGSLYMNHMEDKSMVCAHK